MEPLLKNINKKNIKQINDELDISDFSLLLLTSLINKENQILKENSCLLKKGFYFGDKLSGIMCELYSFKNEFIILFGFKLESTDMDEITLFQIENKIEKIKFFLTKKNIANKYVYEMSVYNSYEEGNQSINLFFEPRVNHVLSIHFQIGRIMNDGPVINVKYVKDDDSKDNGNTKNVLIYNSKEIKIKGLLKKNYTIYFGCEKQSNSIINKFRGFMGDIFFLDIKDKTINNNTISELLLNLRGNYNEIVTIFNESDNNIFMNYKIKNPEFIELKNKIKAFDEKENPLCNYIYTEINTNYLNLVKYNNFQNNKSNLKNKINIEKIFNM
jgi:hypothetical protein